LARLTLFWPGSHLFGQVLFLSVKGHIYKIVYRKKLTANV
jgi:hypothetical protein